MKKFLVILMVVAMASFLFVGCIPTTPDEEVAEEEVAEEEVAEEEEVAVVQTDTPYITGVAGISILSSSTQYINAAEDGTAFTVAGVGVAGAIIKLYIDDVYAGVGSTGDGGSFSGITITAITMAEGADKTLHVTATLPGLAESDASTAYTFTYDKTAPTIASVVGDSSSNYITVTFSEAVASATGPTYRYISALSYLISVTATTTFSPAAVTAPSATTIRLTEQASLSGAANGDLVVGDYLSVLVTDGSTADLAGNLLSVPRQVFGSVVE